MPVKHCIRCRIAILMAKQLYTQGLQTTLMCFLFSLHRSAKVQLTWPGLAWPWPQAVGWVEAGFVSLSSSLAQACTGHVLMVMAYAHQGRATPPHTPRPHRDQSPGAPWPKASQRADPEVQKQRSIHSSPTWQPGKGGSI